MSRRKLTQDEMDLWQRIAEQTEKMHPDRRIAPSLARPKPEPTKRAPTPVQPFTLGQSAKGQAAQNALLPSIEDRVNAAPLQMDRKRFTRMKRGKERPEAKLDLHGMTVDRAHPALTRFILSAQSSGKRLVLVVTGKGKQRDDGDPIPKPLGILRHQVPQWLALPPLSQAVLQVSSAHIAHGGSGAYYVYLRKAR